MIRSIAFLARLTALTLSFAGSALAVPGGDIGTLPTGYYRCQVPGDITGPAGISKPEHDFEIRSASTYATNAGRGSYLLTGDRMVITDGPFNGREFRRISPGTLRAVGLTGEDAKLRCVLVSNRAP